MKLMLNKVFFIALLTNLGLAGGSDIDYAPEVLLAEQIVVPTPTIAPCGCGSTPTPVPTFTPPPDGAQLPTLLGICDANTITRGQRICCISTIAQVLNGNPSPSPTSFTSRRLILLLRRLVRGLYPEPFAVPVAPTFPSKYLYRRGVGAQA